MPLRTMARCLRGIAFMLRVVIARDRFPERDIEIGAHQPVALDRLALAHFERRGAELFAQVIGVRLQRRGGFAVGGQRAAIDAERRGYQRVAEQRRLDMRERQHAHDRAILFGEHVVAAVAERGRDDARPGGAMEEGAARHRRDEGVPGGSAGVIERSQSKRHADWFRVRARTSCAAMGFASLYPSYEVRRCGVVISANTRSMRSQAKSRSSRSRRADMRDRLV